MAEQAEYWDEHYRLELEQAVESHELAYDDRVALVTPALFSKLHNYEASYPTGVYLGKFWRAGEHVLRMYELGDSPGQAKIKSRELIVVEA